MADMAPSETSDSSITPWKILVVDDEPAIHQVTKLALRNLSVLDRPIQLINALSGIEAREELMRHPDIAVILLDVVMETEDAGLRLIRYIREENANALVRIILRTGQPGQAPERQVMVDYDINDYKEKTELTASKLFTSVMSSIRTFGHLQSVEKCRAALEVLGQLNHHLFGSPSEVALAESLVAQGMALGLFSASSCWLDGEPQALIAHNGNTDVPDTLQALRRHALAKPGSLVSDGGCYAAALPLAHGKTIVWDASTARALSAPHTRLLELFVQASGVALAHWSPTAP